MPIRLGLDFDNTIVCYDELFHSLAIERELIPADLPKRKQAVRDFLRAGGREREWTKLQGAVYGERISEAQPFPAACETICQWGRDGIDLVLVSHRTREPVLGPPVDLHESAKAWLQQHQLLDCFSQVCFETTRSAKLQQIARSGREYFVDDLPELLTSPDFPEGVEKILFDPGEQCRDETGFVRCSHWRQIAGWIEERAVD